MGLVSLEQDLQVLPQLEMKDAVQVFVEKDDNDAIRNFVEKALKETQDTIRKDTQTMTQAEDEGNEEETLIELVTKRRDEANMRAKLRREAEMEETEGGAEKENQGPQLAQL